MQPFIPMDLTVAHELFTIKQIDHTIPLKSLSEIPDFTLSATKVSGQVITGHFKLILNPEQIGVHQIFDQVNQVVIEDFTVQMLKHGYRLPTRPAPKPHEWVNAMQALLDQPMWHHVLRGGSHPDHEFLKGCRTMLNTVRTRHNKQSDQQNKPVIRPTWAKEMAVGLIFKDEQSTMLLSLENCAIDLATSPENYLGRHSLREYHPFGYASLEQSGIPMTGVLLSNGLFDYTPTFGDSGRSFVKEIQKTLLYNASCLKGKISNFKISGHLPK
jgi:hypothetical protein